MSGAEPDSDEPIKTQQREPATPHEPPTQRGRGTSSQALKPTSGNKRKSGTLPTSPVRRSKRTSNHSSIKPNYSDKYHPDYDAVHRPQNARKHRHQLGDFSQPTDTTSDDPSAAGALTAEEEAASDGNVDKDQGHESDVLITRESKSTPSSHTNVKRVGSKRSKHSNIPKDSNSRAGSRKTKQASTARTSSTGTLHADEQPFVTLATISKITMSIDEYTVVYRKAWERMKDEEPSRDSFKHMRKLYFGAWEVARMEQEEADEDAENQTLDNSYATHGDDLAQLDDGASELVDTPLFQLHGPSSSDVSPQLDGYAPWQDTRQPPFGCRSRNHRSVIDESQNAYESTQTDGHDSMSSSSHGSPRYSPTSAEELPTTVSPSELYPRRDTSISSKKQSSGENGGHSSSALQDFLRSIPDKNHSAPASTASQICEDIPTQPSDYKDRHEEIYYEGRRNTRSRGDRQQLPIWMPATPRSASQSSETVALFKADDPLRGGSLSKAERHDMWARSGYTSMTYDEFNQYG